MHCIKKLLIKVTTFLIMTNDFYWKFYFKQLLKVSYTQ